MSIRPKCPAKKCDFHPTVIILLYAYTVHSLMLSMHHRRGGEDVRFRNDCIETCTILCRVSQRQTHNNTLGVFSIDVYIMLFIIVTTFYYPDRFTKTIVYECTIIENIAAAAECHTVFIYYNNPYPFFKRICF